MCLKVITRGMGAKAAKTLAVDHVLENRSRLLRVGDREELGGREGRGVSRGKGERRGEWGCNGRTG